MYFYCFSLCYLGDKEHLDLMEYKFEKSLKSILWTIFSLETIFLQEIVNNIKYGKYNYSKKSSFFILAIDSLHILL